MRNMVNITERPAEVEDRAVPGHWEGDLVFGKPTARWRPWSSATAASSCSSGSPTATPPKWSPTPCPPRSLTSRQLRRSLTWDQGKEMAHHAQFTVDTGVPVYFCDPHSPWQRGTNENTNGLLRQYFPKRRTAPPDQAALDAIADELNGRPRQTLGWRTPSEALDQALR